MRSNIISVNIDFENGNYRHLNIVNDINNEFKIERLKILVKVLQNEIKHLKDERKNEDEKVETKEKI